MSTWNFRAVPLIAASDHDPGRVPRQCARHGTLASTAGPEEHDITVAAIPSVDLAGLYIAQDEGLFARQGLHVTIKPIASSKAVIASQLKAGRHQRGKLRRATSPRRRGRQVPILAEASSLRPHTRVLVISADSRITTLAGLVGKKIEVNGTNSIGTLLISALLAENGIAPTKVNFVTDKQGFPDMAGQLQRGQWDAAFLAEPYASKAEEAYGDQVELADLDEGATMNFPIGGYVATQTWARQHRQTAAAFVRAIEEGQALAEDHPSAARVALGKSISCRLR